MTQKELLDSITVAADAAYEGGTTAHLSAAVVMETVGLLLRDNAEDDLLELARQCAFIAVNKIAQELDSAGFAFKEIR